MSVLTLITSGLTLAGMLGLRPFMAARSVANIVVWLSVASCVAVMASFTNLALSASSLGTKYLNMFFVVEREVHDPLSGAIIIPADYTQIGLLLIISAAISVALPLAIVVLTQASAFHTQQ